MFDVPASGMPDPMPQYVYRAEVVKIRDADTILARLDLGVHCSIVIPIRFKGVNAPERNTPEGAAATAWLTNRLPVGTQCVISTYLDHTDRYARLIGRIYYHGCVNEDLVRAGHAVPWDGKGTRPNNSITPTTSPEGDTP
jgi:endonuclease YncB( thermonuclease family)